MVRIYVDQSVKVFMGCRSIICYQMTSARTLEDVASREVTDIHVPVALLSHNTTPDTMLNTGVIPILEQGPDDMGMTKYRFSLASLADGRKTPLYGWAWFTFPTFS